MILLASLLACKEPPVVDPVEAALAERVLDSAETPLRLFIAVSSLAAESCAVSTVESYRFTGGGAEALRAVTPTVEVGESQQEWRFTDVGLDGNNGVLTLQTSADHKSFDVLYYSGQDIVFEAALTVLQCDVVETVDEAGNVFLDGETAVGGSADYTNDNETTSIVALGDKPFAGLHFSPPTVVAPTAGWAIWKSSGDDNTVDESLTLEGAQYIDVDGGVWPGIASGSSWDRPIDVRLP